MRSNQVKTTNNDRRKVADDISIEVSTSKEIRRYLNYPNMHNIY